MEADKSLLMKPAQLQQLIDILLKSPEGCPRDMLYAEPHPSDQVLVMLANLVYTKKISGESDAAYGTRILSGELTQRMGLDGWRLLTTAANTDWSNGYFGAVFAHTGLQQVVVAHRGTDPLSVGALITDLQGIFRTKYTTCMNSATTFVDHVRQAINSANNRHGHYTLAITGHSLGAWLAQITAFSVKHLAISDNRLEKNTKIGIHAKTVGFDSPGARDMLDRVLDDYYNRYEMSVFLEGLDITLYLSAPNHINTCGVHLGKIYHVFNEKSSFNRMKKGTIQYTLAAHAMSNFVDAFKDENRKIGEVSDWAKSKKEFDDLFKGHSKDDDPEYLLEKIHRSKVAENIEILKRSFRVFSKDELQILYKLHKLQQQKRELTILNEFAKNNKLEEKTIKLFPDFDMDYYNRTVACKSGESLAVLCRHLKQLMRWLKPQFTQAMHNQITAFHQAADIMCYAEGQSYLDSLPKCWLDLEDKVGFRDFLNSDTERVLCIVTNSGDGEFQMIRLRNILHQIQSVNSTDSFIKYVHESHYTFLGWPQLQELTQIYGWPIDEEYLLVVDSTSSSITLKDRTELIRYVHSNAMKLVIIASQPIDALNSSEFIKTVNSDRNVYLTDLTRDSQKKLLTRENVIITGDKGYSFRQFLGDDCSVHVISQILSSECLKNFATLEDYAINIKDTRPTLTNLQVPFFNIYIKTSKEFILSCVESPNTNILVVMCGLSRQELETEAGWEQLKGKNIFIADGDAQLFFKDTCNKNQHKSIYLFEVSGGEIYCIQIFNRGFNLPRKFLHRAHIDIQKFKKTKSDDDLFVICCEEDRTSLLRLIGNCNEREAFTENVQIAATKEAEVDIIKKSLNKNIHFVKIGQGEESHEPLLEWRYSHGSVENLRPCVSTNSCKPIEELTLSQTDCKLVIITDEPGMGKTTSLAILSRLIESALVIYIELKHFQTHIDKLPPVLTAKNVASFLLSECCTPADGTLPHVLLEHLLQSKTQSKQLILMFDGFDELDDYVNDKDNAKEKVVRILIFLKNIPTVQIFLTVRKYLGESLEKKLNTFSTCFDELNSGDQLEFLVKFWQSCLSLELEGPGEQDNGRLRVHAEELLREVKRVLGSDMDCFMGVPLQLRMLAEVYRPQSRLLARSPELLHLQIDIASAPKLYKRFIALKYDIYFHDKTLLGTKADNLLKGDIFEDISAMHGELGFRTFFSNFYNKFFDNISEEWLNEMNRHGLIESRGNGEFQFVHRTYAEYCCAQMVVHWLSKRDSPFRYQLVKEVLLPQILLQPDSKIIRLFLNAELIEIPISETAHKLNSKYISKLWLEDSAIFMNQEHQTALHIAVQERNEHIVTLLLGGLGIDGTEEAFLSLITQYDLNNNTAMNIQDIPKLFNNNINNISNSEDHLLNKVLSNILQCIDTCSNEAKDNILFACLFNRDILRSYVSNYLLKSSDVICDTSKVFDRVKEIELEIVPFFEAILENNVSLVREILYERLKHNIERYCFLLITPRTKYLFNTALHQATEHGHLDVVELLAEQTSVPFGVLLAQRHFGQTPLDSAASHGHLNIVKFCVEHVADIDTQFGGGSTLSYAAKSGHLHIVEYLVESGASIGMTILHDAARGGHLSTVEYLVGSGADINTPDIAGDLAIHIAAQKGHLPTVQYLAERGGNTNYMNNFGETVLHKAAKEGQLLTVEYLVKMGADIHAKDNEGATALHVAARGDHLLIIEYLVKIGAGIHTTDNKGVTALHEAARGGHLSTIEYLVKSGADAESISKDGATAMHSAAARGDLSVVEYLVQSGVNIGKTVLHKAAAAGHLLVVEYLVRSGADIDSVDNYNKTALDCAVDGGRWQVVERLLQQGADPNRAGKGGKTALTRASRGRKWKVVRLLLEWGVNVKADNGEALIWAIRSKEWPIVKLLVDEGALVRICDIKKNVSEFRRRFRKYRFEEDY